MAEQDHLGLEDAIAEGVLFGEFRPSSDEKWAELTAEDAPFARAALRRAQQIKHLYGPVAEILYREGVCDLAMYRKRLAETAAYDPANDLVAGM
jgi:hypothetical protein